MGAASSLSARDTKGLLFRALRDGRNIHRKDELSLAESREEVARYRATLQRWVVDAEAFQFASQLTLHELELLEESTAALEQSGRVKPNTSGRGRLPPDFAEELLESNWKAKTVENFYATHRGRQEHAKNVICFVLPMLSIQDWVPSALVCKNWTCVCRAADDLWHHFLFDLVKPSLKETAQQQQSLQPEVNNMLADYAAADNDSRFVVSNNESMAESKTSSGIDSSNSSSKHNSKRKTCQSWC